MKKILFTLLLLTLLALGTSAQDTDAENLAERLAGRFGGEIVALQYDEEGGEELPEGQTRLVAEVIRDLQAQLLLSEPVSDAEADEILAEGIVEIQLMAAAVGATTYEGAVVTLPWEEHATWLGWCSNITGDFQSPPDTYMPLGYGHSGHGSIFVWGTPLYDAAPNPILMSFSGCLGGNVWVVAIE
jgi:hypothetical protein